MEVGSPLEKCMAVVSRIVWNIQEIVRIKIIYIFFTFSRLERKSNFWRNYFGIVCLFLKSRDVKSESQTQITLNKNKK